MKCVEDSLWVGDYVTRNKVGDRLGETKLGRNRKYVIGASPVSQSIAKPHPRSTDACYDSLLPLPSIMQGCDGTITDQSNPDDIENDVSSEDGDRGPIGPHDGHSIRTGNLKCVPLITATRWDDLGRNLLAKCTSEAFYTVTGSGRLASRIRAELEHLESAEVNEQTLKGNNLPHLDAVVRVASSASGLSAFLKTFLSKDYSSGNQQEVVRRHSVTVDVVCNTGSRWIKVSARNPYALQRQFLGQERHGRPDVVTQTEALLRASKQNLKGYSPPDVVCYFDKGVTCEVREALFRLGATVIGDKIVDSQKAGSQVKTECYPGYLSSSECQRSDVSVLAVLDIPLEQDSRPHLLNLDVTTLLAYVSEITNGSTFIDFKEDVLRLQANEEILSPVLPVLRDTMRGKDLIACQSAISAFETILETIGGPNEKQRARLLLGQIRVVDDLVSDRVSHLKQSSQIRPRSKVIFGTGDSERAVTVTANASFVRAAAQQGIELSVFLHSPRALTERKEAAKQKSKDVKLLVQCH